MEGKKILIGISGSIAAFKIPILVRMLIRSGAAVKIIMTPAARSFVSPLVLETLSKNKVLHSISEESEWANHVMLGRWADLFLLAPASCNTLAKLAHGHCDNLLLAVLLSAVCPVVIAPAMDEDMWHHATTQKNLKTLAEIGYQMMEAEYGELASGLSGMGRMPEPETIFQTLSAHFKEKEILSGKKALVTAGPTYENIDPVRFIGNYSSGKMGVAIAKRLAHLGAKVELVLGPVQLEVSHPNIRVTKVRSAEQMFDACINIFPECEFAIMSAAVADYTPESVADEKIKKQEGSLQIQLKKTKDILKHLGTLKSPQQVLIGFALESKDEKAYAIRKLNEKNADAIVMNSIRTPGAGFAVDTNQVTIFEKDGVETAYELKPKEEVAQDIVEKMLTIYRQKFIQ